LFTFPASAKDRDCVAKYILLQGTSDKNINWGLCNCRIDAFLLLSSVTLKCCHGVVFAYLSRLRVFSAGENVSPATNCPEFLTEQTALKSAAATRHLPHALQHLLHRDARSSGAALMHVSGNRSSC
jgi:hypothetical protein